MPKWQKSRPSLTVGEPPTNGVANPDSYISRTTESDLKRVSDFVRDKYGYETGSYTNFPADESNYKLLARLGLEHLE